MSQRLAWYKQDFIHQLWQKKQWYYMNYKNHVILKVPANSHALCVSHTPADSKHRSLACRTISRLRTHNSGPTCSLTIKVKNCIQNSPIKGTKWVLLSNKLTRSRKDSKIRTATFDNLRKSSNIFDHVRKLSENLRQCGKVIGNFLGNSGNMDKKISRIWLKKSWQVYFFYLLYQLSQIIQEWRPDAERISRKVCKKSRYTLSRTRNKTKLQIPYFWSVDLSL